MPEQNEPHTPRMVEFDVLMESLDKRDAARDAALESKFVQLEKSISQSVEIAIKDVEANRVKDTNALDRRLDKTNDKADRAIERTDRIFKDIDDRKSEIKVLQEDLKLREGAEKEAAKAQSKTMKTYAALNLILVAIGVVVAWLVGRG